MDKLLACSELSVGDVSHLHKEVMLYCAPLNLWIHLKTINTSSDVTSNPGWQIVAQRRSEWPKLGQIQDISDKFPKCTEIWSEKVSNLSHLGPTSLCCNLVRPWWRIVWLCSSKTWIHVMNRTRDVTFNPSTSTWQWNRNQWLLLP